MPARPAHPIPADPPSQTEEVAAGPPGITPSEETPHPSQSQTEGRAEKEDRLPGRRVGQSWLLNLHLPAEARKLLDRACRVGEEPRSKGSVVGEALRATWHEIVMANALPVAEDAGPFGPRRIVRRRDNLADPKMVGCYVTEG